MCEALCLSLPVHIYLCSVHVSSQVRARISWEGYPTDVVTTLADEDDFRISPVDQVKDIIEVSSSAMRHCTLSSAYSCIARCCWSRGVRCSTPCSKRLRLLLRRRQLTPWEAQQVEHQYQQQQQGQRQGRQHD